MIDIPDEVAISAITAEVQRIRARLPDSRWFFFGSITTSKRPVGDIDLLVVCETTEDCTMIRNGLGSICAQFPVHLLLMSAREEVEVKFIQNERAVEIALG
jgi:hypothetical protein